MKHQDITKVAFDKFFTEDWYAEFLLENNRIPSVLDIGARDAKFMPYFRDKKINYSSCDMEPQHGTVEQLPMEELDSYYETDFDILFYCHSFEHTINPLQTLRASWIITKPNGYIFISLPYYCRHQVLGADKDHNFVLTEIQLRRLLISTKWEIMDSWIGKGVNKDEKGWSQIIVGRKGEEKKK